MLEFFKFKKRTVSPEKVGSREHTFIYSWTTHVSEIFLIANVLSYKDQVSVSVWF